MREGRELRGPHESGGPRRRGVYLARRVAAVLALLVVMVLVAPQAYKALVGSNAGSDAPAPGANDAENPVPEEPVAEQPPPADVPEERAAEPSSAASSEKDAAEEPAPAEPVEKDAAAKPAEDDPKDEERVSADEPAPAEPEPVAPEVEDVSAALLVAEEQYAAAQYDVVPTVAVEAQYAAVEQYPVEAQYVVEDQYFAAEQPVPVLPEPVLPEPTLPDPVALVEPVIEEIPLDAALAPATEILEPIEPSFVPDAVETSELQAAPAAAPAKRAAVPVEEEVSEPVAVESTRAVAGGSEAENQNADCGDETGAAEVSSSSSSSSAVASSSKTERSEQVVTDVCGTGTASASAQSSSSEER